MLCRKLLFTYLENHVAIWSVTLFLLRKKFKILSKIVVLKGFTKLGYCRLLMMPPYLTKFSALYFFFFFGYTPLKTLDTIGNCQRPVFSPGVSKHMRKITNM